MRKKNSKPGLIWLMREHKLLWAIVLGTPQVFLIAGFIDRGRDTNMDQHPLWTLDTCLFSDPKLAEWYLEQIKLVNPTAKFAESRVVPVRVTVQEISMEEMLEEQTKIRAEVLEFEQTLEENRKKQAEKRDYRN